MKANLRLNLIVSNVWKYPCANQSQLGLYFKLHGTHRANSLKKTVTKRQKRVQQNSKTNFRWISYPSCEKALINRRKTSTRGIFNISKTEKVINFQLRVILPRATNY